MDSQCFMLPIISEYNDLFIYTKWSAQDSYSESKQINVSVMWHEILTVLIKFYIIYKPSYNIHIIV